MKAVLDNPMLAAAVESARNGLPVYPARPRDKAPLYRGWQRAATTKIDRLAQHWKGEPEANVGIACRGITVLDADSHRGEDALADLALPATTTVRTRRGVHLYFAGNAPTVPRLLEDVEVRGKGSGVLGAGSVHPSGHIYEWEIPPWEIEPVAIPGELRALIENSATRKTGVTPGPIYEGERSVRLLKMGASLRGQHGVENVAAALHAINQVDCSPPLPAAKVEEVAAYVDGSVGAAMWILDPGTFCNADPRLSQTARVVLRLLCDHANVEGKCHPGYRRLAHLARMRPNTIGAALDELEEAGRISIRRSRRGNRYRLLRWGPSAPTVHKGLTSVSPSVTLDRGLASCS